MGDWDMTVFLNEDGAKGTNYDLGQWFLIIFLILNLVLMINLVIAILSSTYVDLSRVSNGLYCDTLVKVFPIFDWDHLYGSLVVAHTPMQVLYPIVIALLNLCPNDYVVWLLNETFANIFFLPVGLIVTAFFTFLNTLLMPVAYFSHIYTLSSNIRGKENGTQKVKRSIICCRFAIFGLIWMLLSLIIDTIVFFYNLYTEPKKKIDQKQQDDLDQFKRYGLQTFEDTVDDATEVVLQQLRYAKAKGKPIRAFKNSQGGFLINFRQFNQLM